MKGLWLENNALLYKTDLPIPKPPPGEALVRVRLAGICSTDLELIRGYYPYQGILGHEFVGDIVQAEDAPERVGQRVVGEINAVCGNCYFCQHRQPNHCEERTVLGIKNRNGAFAEYLCLPLENLIPVPVTVPDEKAVFTEPLAAALEIQEQLTLHPTHRVLVIGAGRLGQLIARTLALTGCDLQVAARHDKQCRLLAAHHIPWLEENQIPARSYDVVVEATGSSAGFALARQAVRPRGTLVMKSTFKGDTPVNLASLVVDEISLIGSRCGPFGPALRLLQNKLVDPSPLVEGRFHLGNGLQAFERAGQPGVLKILFQIFC